MCISSHNGSTRLLICNNDETIKVYSLPGLQRITSIALPTAVNYAAVSPDGRKMVAVGDSNQVYLYDVTPSGNYQRISTLTGLYYDELILQFRYSCVYFNLGCLYKCNSYHCKFNFFDFLFFTLGTNDAGFSCAWNQSSDKFAVASQDGFVSVWDIRNTEKMAKLGSKQV